MNWWLFESDLFERAVRRLYEKFAKRSTEIKRLDYRVGVARMMSRAQDMIAAADQVFPNCERSAQ